MTAAIPAPRVAPADEQDTTEELRARLKAAEQRIADLTQENSELIRDIADVLARSAATAEFAARQGHKIRRQNRDLRSLENEVASRRRAMFQAQEK